MDRQFWSFQSVRTSSHNPDRDHCRAAMRCGIELLAGEILDPLAEKPDGRLGTTLVDGLDGNVGNVHSTTLA